MLHYYVYNILYYTLWKQGKAPCRRPATRQQPHAVVVIKPSQHRRCCTRASLRAFISQASQEEGVISSSCNLQMCYCFDYWGNAWSLIIQGRNECWNYLESLISCENWSNKQQISDLLFHKRIYVTMLKRFCGFSMCSHMYMYIESS